MVVVGHCVGRLDSLIVVHLDCDRLVCLVDQDVDPGDCYAGLVVLVDADLVACLACLDVVAYLGCVVAVQELDLVYFVVDHCLVVEHVSVPAD